jgi:hypothetical protein
MTEASRYFPVQGLPMIDQSGHGIEAPSTFQPAGVSNFLPSGSM